MTALPHKLSPLAARRVALGMTQTELAAAAGCSQRCVSSLETGHRGRATVQRLVRLARALGTTVEELFGADDPAGGKGAGTAPGLSRRSSTARALGGGR